MKHRGRIQAQGENLEEKFMVTHLYKDFLQNKQVYIQTIEYWKTIVYTLLSTEGIEFEDYLTIKKKDGSLYSDGNPIFHFKVKNSNRAIRIIQEEPETEKLEFTAWLNKLEITNGEQIDEVVIGLALSNESVLFAIEVINAWILNQFPIEKMERFLHKLTSLKKRIFLDNRIIEKEIA